MDSGAEAFFERLLTAYPEVTPSYVGTRQSWRDGGPDPLDVLAFIPTDSPSPHWHVVGYGLSGPGEDGDTGRGWGFELSTRVTKEAEDNDPPAWAFGWLQSLASYVAESGVPLSPGDQMPANGPVRVGSSTALEAMLFRRDPELDPLVEPTMVQVVAVTRDELRAKRCWQFEPMLDLLERELGSELIVDLKRESVLSVERVAREASHGAIRDGSSTRTLIVSSLGIREGRRLSRRSSTVSIDALVAEDLGLLVAARLDHGRQLDLESGDGRVLHLVPCEEVQLSRAAEGHWVLTLPGPAVRWLWSELPLPAGTYRPEALAPVNLEIVAIDVTDREGRVTHRVG